MVADYRRSLVRRDGLFELLGAAYVDVGRVFEGEPIVVSSRTGWTF